MNEQKLKNELERPRTKVDDDFSEWNDAVRELKKKKQMRPLRTLL